MYYVTVNKGKYYNTYCYIKYKDAVKMCLKLDSLFKGDAIVDIIGG